MILDQNEPDPGALDGGETRIARQDRGAVRQGVGGDQQVERLDRNALTGQQEAEVACRRPKIGGLGNFRTARGL